MIVSSSHKFVFIHVPKNAGSSVTESLRPYADWKFERIRNRLFLMFGVNTYLGLYKIHTKPHELLELWGEKKFNNYYKFAFVRNPFDREVSLYHYHSQKPDASRHQQVKSKSFAEYLEWSYSFKHLNTQKKFLSDANGNILVNRVGRFENLVDDFNDICKNIGISARIEHKNASFREKDYRKYYTPELKKIIEEKCAEDLNFFNYSF